MRMFKRIIVVLICILLLSGCVKNYNTITINKDKSMVYETELLFSNTITDEVSRYVDTSIYEKNGFNVTTVKEEGYSGYKITKSYESIDDLSNNSGEDVKISDILENVFDASKMFKREKGFFKDTYSASFIYLANTSKYSTVQEVENVETDENTSENSETTEDNTTVEDDNLLNLAGEMEFNFTINLPYKSNSNNASNISDDEKTLSWSLIGDQNNNISFSFDIYNINNIVLVGVGILLFIIIVIVVIVIIKKKKFSKETLIHTDFDPSIADKINGDDIKKESINQPQSLEYTLPEEKTSNHIEVQEKGPQFLVQKIEEEPEVIELPTGPQIKVPNAEPVSSSTNSEN